MEVIGKLFANNGAELRAWLIQHTPPDLHGWVAIVPLWLAVCMAMLAGGALVWTVVKFVKSAASGFRWVGKFLPHPWRTVIEVVAPEPAVTRKDLLELEARLKEGGGISKAEAERLFRETLAHALGRQSELLAHYEAIKSGGAAIQALPAALHTASRPGLPPAPTVAEALQLLVAGRTQAAEAAFSNVLEIKSQEGAHANREAAAAARHLGALSFFNDKQQALKAYARATELDPNDPEAWDRLGVLQEETDAFDAAQESFEKASMLGQRLGENWWVAQAYSDMGGMWAKLAIRMKAAIRHDRANADEGGPLLDELLTKGERCQSHALEIFEELGDQEGMAKAHGLRAEIFHTGGKPEKACADWRKAKDLYASIGTLDLVNLMKSRMHDAGCPDRIIGAQKKDSM
jgi:tetratricopeptide (TPR) repeat protein